MNFEDIEPKANPIEYKRKNVFCRNIWCSHYDTCLDWIIKNRQNWHSFSCASCPYKDDDYEKYLYWLELLEKNKEERIIEVNPLVYTDLKEVFASDYEIWDFGTRQRMWKEKTEKMRIRQCMEKALRMNKHMTRIIEERRIENERRDSNRNEKNGMEELSRGIEEDT